MAPGAFDGRLISVPSLFTVAFNFFPSANRLTKTFSLFGFGIKNFPLARHSNTEKYKQCYHPVLSWCIVAGKSTGWTPFCTNVRQHTCGIQQPEFCARSVKQHCKEQQQQLFFLYSN